MKKIAAFVTALAMFLVVAVSAHFIIGDKLDTNNLNFGTWINSKKDLSYKAISSNIEEDTVMMMGSSEFNYGKKTPYHPTAVFRSLGMNVMCIGAAQNQSLSHAITLGAVAPELKNKKVVLILSPSWFSKSGVKQSGFAARFSASEYEAFLKNDNISEETKETVATRVTELLEISPKAQTNAQTIRAMLTTGDASFKNKVYFAFDKWFTNEKENINVGLLWKATGEKNYAEYKTLAKGEEPDWDALAKQADAELKGKMNNDFHMKDSMYKKKVAPVLSERKNSDLKRTYGDSPEYDDLRIFLDVCKQENIEVLLVMLPVNGWYYDYTGFPRENRETFVTEVNKVAEEYGVETKNFFGECYTPGFLTDIVHPAGKGWVRINEAAYRFFNED